VKIEYSRVLSCRAETLQQEDKHRVIQIIIIIIIMANQFAAFAEHDEDAGYPSPPPLPGGDDHVFTEIEDRLILQGDNIREAWKLPPDDGPIRIVNEALDAAGRSLSAIPETPASVGRVKKLHVRLDLLYIDCERLIMRASFSQELFENVKESVQRALRRVDSARTAVDEVFALIEAGAALPPHAADIAADREKLSQIIEMLYDDVNEGIKKVDRLIAAIRREMQPLAGGRVSARSRVGDDAWNANCKRAGWTPCGAAKALKALTDRLKALEALKIALDDAIGSLRPRSP
jgi:hypothetical protein